jgi:glycosyltransferase involved in cell wall biosynthesis
MQSNNSPGLSKPRILLFADWFEPGYKAGGPIRSCLHFVHLMKDKYDCFVFTTDRDLNATAPYENIQTDRWIAFNPQVQIYYCSPANLSWKHVLREIKAVKPDFIYLNSMYSLYFTIYPLLMRRLGFIREKIVLSPRGMLRESAMQFKTTKKRFFLSLFRLLGIHKQVHFHATDQTEQNDIKKQFGPGVTVTLARNSSGFVHDYAGSIEKRAGELKIVFVGRLHPIKNLDYLLELLPQVKGIILLTITGSEEDKGYVAHCKSIIEKFPGHISVRFTGELPNNRLPEVMHQHHIFASPTQGENFGHAIFEALAVGKPVLISDQTPWQNLFAKKAGWVINLQQKEQFIGALQQAVDFNQQQYDEWSKAAWQHAADFAKEPDVKDLYYHIFS